jgi:hypothetical protein
MEIGEYDSMRVLAKMGGQEERTWNEDGNLLEDHPTQCKSRIVGEFLDGRSRKSESTI